MITYAGQYLFPPRPDNPVPVGQLEFYENRGWWAQSKKNGTCALITVTPGSIQMMNRHHQPLKWTMPRGVAEFLHDHLNQTTVFAAELLHHKTVATKNTLYLFDVLVARGEYLLGTNYAFRYDALVNLFPHSVPGITHNLLNPRVWMARCIGDHFLDYFNGLAGDDEGIVLKDPMGILRDCSKASSNGYWQVKCRRQTKNYSF